MTEAARSETPDRAPDTTADLGAPAQAQQLQPDQPLQQEGGTAEVVRQMEGDHAAAAPQQADDAPLFPADEAGELQGRWQEIQASFVDEPRQAVQQADELVAGAIKRLAQTFADERSQLEGQWDQGEQVSTEDLRLALQKYRTFFGRLLAV